MGHCPLLSRIMSFPATPERSPRLHTTYDLFSWRTILETPPLGPSLSPSQSPLALSADHYFCPIPTIAATYQHLRHCKDFSPSPSPELQPESPSHFSCESSSEAEGEAMPLQQMCWSTDYVPQPTRNRRPSGRFPFHELGRCPHKSAWQRLRGKRGFSYFQCRQCGMGWRQPTKPTDAVIQASF
eukprot:GGOE01055581.1.p1 GENE.GGOE01055581.1~~GGOE01055581.1.p1  ORF type:complete len:206 (+),score=37.57 GGOE01055581.1:68-619(+)